MENNRHIIGTAGHVDHGKTALIKALTGYDCDTHKEEKSRGITIHLGFTHLKLPSGDEVGIVDVPGHKDYVKTMVSGATGINFCLLVVAADEGIKPQTTEHLQIMQILGITQGVLVITKSDLEMRSKLIENLTELTNGTFLEGKPFVQVSSTSQQGIEDLKQEIEKRLKKIERPEGSRIFRLYVDRVFSKSGFGTVVTGSSNGGTLTKKKTCIYFWHLE